MILPPGAKTPNPNQAESKDKKENKEEAKPVPTDENSYKDKTAVEFNPKNDQNQANVIN